MTKNIFQGQLIEKLYEMRVRMNLPRLFFFSDSLFSGGFGGLTVGVYTGSGVARSGNWISGKEGIFDIFAFLSWKWQDKNDFLKPKQLMKISVAIFAMVKW